MVSINAMNASSARLPGRRIILITIIMLVFSGCAAPVKRPGLPEPSPLMRLKPSDLPDFFDDLHFDGLAHAIAQNINYLERVPKQQVFRFGNDQYSPDHMIRSIAMFKEFIQTQPSAQALKRFLIDHFRIYQSIGRKNSASVLFTGYYEPILRGCSRQTDQCRFPVYTLPEDLITVDLSPFSSKYKGQRIIGRFTGRTLVPYYDREAIDSKGILKDRVGSLAWIADPVDLFFLQIQGSGKIYLDNDRLINVHYHRSNGRPYKSIGKLLIDTGKIPREKMSMQAIRAYLKAHPETIPDVLNYNPSYVFFKEETDGPLGSLGVKLTPGRSLATDYRIFPKAALTFIQTQKPLVDADGKIQSWTALNRFVLNQDTGGAIRGPGRADLFWGNGSYAEIAAGHLQHPGRLYFMVLKPGG